MIKMVNSDYAHNRGDNHGKNSQSINGNLALFMPLVIPANIRNSKVFEKEIHITFIKNQDFSNIFQIYEPIIDE